MLKETFDSSYKLYHSILHDPPYEYSYQFTTVDKNSYRNINDEVKTYVIKFQYDGDGIFIFEFYKEPDRYDLTGTGDEFKILSTIIKSIKLFYDEVRNDEINDGIELKEITFSADKTERSRIKLYDRLLKTLAKEKDFNYKINHLPGKYQFAIYSLYPMTFKNEYDKL